VYWLAQPSESEAAAQSLFAVLRELDARGVQQIWVELPPDTPDWEGVRDRLKRAAA
jgi:L-threonylcarbamoyladenylate synthase